MGVGWSGQGEFTRWLIENRYADKSIEAYVSHARRANTLLTADGRTLRRAKTTDLRDYMATLAVSAASWNQARKALHAYFRSIGRRPNPVDDINAVPEPERLPRPLSGEAHVRFLAAAQSLDGVHRVVGLLFATTGVRFSGLQRAKWTQFELNGDMPLWRIQGKGAGRRGARPYQVPIHSMVAPVIVAWRGVCLSPEWLLPGRTNAGHISERILRRTFADICELAGLEGVVPHQLRHTVATAALEQSDNLRAVQELLGHANITSTQMYTKVTPSRLRDLVEALPA